MKTLTAQTTLVGRVIALSHVIAVLGLTATVEAREVHVDNVQTTPEHTVKQQSKLEQQVQQYEPVVNSLSCKQLVGEERHYKTDPRPQVECESSVVGVFFWHLKDERGNWQNVYFNQRPNTLSGYMFSRNPGEIRIRFMDLDGNTSDYFITLDTDYKPCIQTQGCLMV